MATVTNGRNQLSTVGGVAAAQDGRGNLTSDPVTGKTFTYDSENRLTSASGGISVYHDPLGRISEYDTTVSSRFMYDGAKLAVEVDNPTSNVVRRYVRGDGPDELLVWYEGPGTADRRFLSKDERGSVIAVSDASGNELSINSYDEYGRPGAANAGRFQYTGQMWLPELGAYDYKDQPTQASIGAHESGHTYQYQQGAFVSRYALAQAAASASRGINAMENQADDFAESGRCR